ncbi:MAG: hypothetical protein ACOYB3_05560 [Azonexus sp.]
MTQKCGRQAIGGELADAVLLEAFGIAYRAGLPVDVARIAGELARRLKARRGAALEPEVVEGAQP